MQEGTETLTPEVKRRFARLIAFDLRINAETSPMSMAAYRLAQSLARAFETGRPNLVIFEPLSAIEWAMVGNAGSGADAP